MTTTEQKAIYYHIRNGLGLIMDFMPEPIELFDINLYIVQILFLNEQKNYVHGPEYINITASYGADSEFLTSDIEILDLLKCKNPLTIKVVKNDLDDLCPIDKILGVEVLSVDIVKKELKLKAQAIKEK